MTSATLSVPSISCGHCKATIEGALAQVSGVESASVSVDDHTVTVAFDDKVVDVAAIQAAITEQGYEVAS